MILVPDEYDATPVRVPVGTMLVGALLVGPVAAVVEAPLTGTDAAVVEPVSLESVAVVGPVRGILVWTVDPTPDVDEVPDAADVPELVTGTEVTTLPEVVRL